MNQWSELAAWAALVLALSSALSISKFKRQIGYAAYGRKWKKAVNGERYKPKQFPEKISDRISEDDRTAIKPFSGVAAYFNRNFSETNWSFEDIGVVDYGEGHSGEPYREIQIYYNQAKTGSIKFCVVNYKSIEPPHVRLELILKNARQFSGEYVYGMALSISSIVKPYLEDELPVETKIHAAMVQAVWQTGEGTELFPTLELRFRGTGEYWLEAYKQRTSGGN